MHPVILPAVLLLVSGGCSADYWADRQQIINNEHSQMLGSRLTLSAEEEAVNRKLMEMKYAEFDAGFNDPKKFLPSRHFFEAKAGIEASPVFALLKDLPKGASLHSHDTALASYDVLYNLTYWDNLYSCTSNDRLRLQFFAPQNIDDTCDWMLISERRAQNDTYDAWVRKQLTLVVDRPKEVYTDINTVWSAFISIFITVTPMLTYRPVFEEYFYQVLTELYEDNVMYLEFRGTIPEVYDLEGKIYTPVEIVGMYKSVTEEFKSTHPDFIGVKFIFAPLRLVDNATLDGYMGTLADIQEAHGDFVAGFDLVGQEDLGVPLVAFIEKLEVIKQTSKLFFHAGETNWYGSSSDLNLVDAVLLGTQRIGHGFALVKRPEVLKMVKERGIGIEIAPISNQVLLLVDDLRNHPGSILFAGDYPVVICSDDPTFWGSKALSYDWYEAYMGFGSREADLRTLKQLAINSLEYSSLEGNAKARAIEMWTLKWKEFILKYSDASNSSFSYLVSVYAIVGSIFASIFCIYY